MTEAVETKGQVDEAGKQPAAKKLVEPPKNSVRVTVKIAGTRKSGFRFNCGGIEQYQLDVTREFTHEQAKRIADLVVELVSQKDQKNE